MATSTTGALVLSSKWCLVTGAGRGIGKSIAEEFARNGASLILTARTEDQLKDVAESCKEKGAAEVEVHAVDLSEPQQVEVLASSLLQKHGRIDVLINNAGQAVPSNPLEGDPDVWDKMIALNLSAPMRLTRRLAPAMVESKQGLIVNISSVAGVTAMGGNAAYCATKFGLNGWSSSCYEALRPHNIKVMCICPGFVNTPLAQGIQGVDFEKMIQPQDIADAVMLAVRCSPSCVPEMMVMKVVQTPYIKS